MTVCVPARKWIIYIDSIRVSEEQMQHMVKFSILKTLVVKCIGLFVRFSQPPDVGLCESVSLFDLLLLLHIWFYQNHKCK